MEDKTLELMVSGRGYFENHVLTTFGILRPFIGPGSFECNRLVEWLRID